MHAAITKIPHLLYEEDLLKTRKWCMILFTIHGLFTKNMMGMGEKTRNIQNVNAENKLIYPGWDGGPSLVGQRNKGLGTVCSTAVKLPRMWIIYIWTFKIFKKWGLGYGFRLARVRPGISTVLGINSHGRVHYRPQVGYNNRRAVWDF